MGKNEEGFVADYLHANLGNFGWFQHGSRNSNHVSRWPVVRNIGAFQHVGIDALRAQATDFDAARAVCKRKPFGKRNGRVFGDGVGGGTNLGEQACSRCGAAEISVSACQPFGQQIFRGPPVSIEVDVERGFPHIFGCG